MKKRSLDKVIITPEMKERQLKLRKFLRENKITHKELRPIGFSIDVSTIPQNKESEFLEIANSISEKKS